MVLAYFSFPPTSMNVRIFWLSSTIWPQVKGPNFP
jgi:hypothetical protein